MTGVAEHGGSGPGPGTGLGERPRVGSQETAPRSPKRCGLVLLVAGPDGSGKSTLAEKLAAGSGGLFPATMLVHWRPGILPRPGGLLGRPEADVTRPHAQAPHNRLVSVALLTYHLADFVLGNWFRIGPARRRGDLVVIERGWWDMAVDPRRYRMDVPRRLVLAYGRLLPRPDLAIVLEGPAEVLASRKHELPPDEVARQVAAWRDVLPGGVRHAYVDVSLPLDDVVDRVRDEIELARGDGAVRGRAPGWANLPNRRASRWIVPRRPRSAARTGLLVYHPVTLRGRAGWEMARVLARAGAFRLLPLGVAPGEPLRDAVASFLGPGTTMAVANANHPGRFIVLVLGEQGECRLVAKVATEASGAAALDREGEALERLGPLAQPPLHAPRVVARSPGVLVLEAAPWRPRICTWRIPEDVASALGAFYRRGAQGDAGPAHGDCAPWNLLRNDEGWTLIDWEEARDDAFPFYDLFHYLVRSHTLLGRPSLGAIRRGLAGKGWVGKAIRAYAQGGGLSPGDAPSMFASYLRTRTQARFDPEGRRAKRRRRRLGESLLP